MVAYWLLYDILEEEGLLDEYGIDKVDPYSHYASEPTGNVTLTTDFTPHGKCKFSETDTLDKAKAYICETYGAHYAGDKLQTLDYIESIGDAQAFCRSNAIKYLSRYEKKGSANLDILKAIHYCVLLYHFNDKENE